MKLKCCCNLLWLCFVITVSADAQRIRNGIWELGVIAGGSNYHGDLAREIVIKETHPMAGILMRKNFSKFFAYRVQFAMGRISGNDKNFKDYAYRGLMFRSNIWEISNQFEFNFLPFGINPRERRSTTYFVSGLNLFGFNPKVKYGNSGWVEARRIGTEGQGLNGKRRYSPVQLSIPIGMGYKKGLGKRWVLGFEVVFRKTFTDYLDDVSGEYPDYKTMQDKKGQLAADLSQPQTLRGDPVINAQTQRGDPKLKDWYFFSAFTLTYRFVPIQCPNQ